MWLALLPPPGVNMQQDFLHGLSALSRSCLQIVGAVGCGTQSFPVAPIISTCLRTITPYLYRKERKERKVYAIRRYNGSFCTQKQPETAAFRALKAATRKGKQKDPKGGQPAVFCVYDQFYFWSSLKTF